jgi:hypothetical protein
MGRHWIMRVIPFVLCLFLAAPLAFVATFLSSPFWNWFESATGIESFGHSGPADWCFEVTYIAIVIVSATVYTLAQRK